MQTLHLKRDRHSRILGGHLWAFAGEISEDLKQLRPGEAVALCEARGRLLGRGYINPHSLIAVRLLTRGDEEWDDGLFQRRIELAYRYRTRVCPNWAAYRLIYAESDGLPGLVVDRYGDHLVIQSLTVGIEIRLKEITDALTETVQPESIFLKGKGHFRRLENLPEEDRQLYGSTPERIVFQEDGANFTARPKEGQKSGFYLDQRTNRHMLKGLIEGKRVLDLFSYTGAWGTGALLEGASEAVMVESSARAVQWGMEDAALNGVSGRSLFIKADVGEFLSDAHSRGDRFDVVVLDPPSMIPSRSALKKGTSAYLSLNRAALRVVAEGGYLVSCSCSHLMSREQHLAVIGEAAVKEGRRIRLVQAGGHPPDHPILPGHPETEYLKCWVLAVA